MMALQSPAARGHWMHMLELGRGEVVRGLPKFVVQTKPPTHSHLEHYSYFPPSIDAFVTAFLSSQYSLLSLLPFVCPNTCPLQNLECLPQGPTFSLIPPRSLGHC